MGYNNYRKPDSRLMYIIGKLKLFFSFDPEYVLCERCHWRKQTHKIESTVDGGGRKDKITFYCNACYRTIFD